jgi:Tol biopolymer transport system component
MPELEEVFRVATQKVRRDAGAMERQLEKQRRAARNRKLGALTVVAVVLAGAGAAVAVLGGNPNGAPASKSPSAIPIQNASGSMLDLRTGQITPLPASIATSGDYYAVSPDHETVAFNACCSTSGPVYTTNIDGTQLNPVSSGAEAGFAAQWSPDGSMLVYQQRPYSGQLLGNLYVWNVVTGQRTRVTNLDQTHSWGFWAMLPSFSADGTSILFQLPRGRLPGDNNRSEDLWSVPVTGGEPVLVRRDASSGYYSPDGRSLMYVSKVCSLSCGQDGLWIRSVQGGTPYLAAQGDLGWPRWSPDATRISYTKNGSVYVFSIATGSATKVADGGNAEWFDNDTLVVAHPST